VKISKDLHDKLFRKLKSLPDNKIVVQTLGKKADVSFSIETGPRIICTNAEGTERNVSRIFEKVLERYMRIRELEKGTKRKKPSYLKTTTYGTDKWKDSPDKIFAPYIAAIIAYINDEHPSYAKCQRSPKIPLKQPHLRL